MTNVVLGFAPTRRSIFSAPDEVKCAALTIKKSWRKQRTGTAVG
nr:hypothetical protein [uncultured Clostridium sp.]